MLIKLFDNKTGSGTIINIQPVYINLNGSQILVKKRIHLTKSLCSLHNIAYQKERINFQSLQTNKLCKLVNLFRVSSFSFPWYAEVDRTICLSSICAYISSVFKKKNFDTQIMLNKLGTIFTNINKKKLRKFLLKASSANYNNNLIRYQVSTNYHLTKIMDLAIQGIQT